MPYKTVEETHTSTKVVIVCGNQDCRTGFVLTHYREWEDDRGKPRVQTHTQCCCKFCPYCGKEIKPINLDKEKENDKSNDD